VHARPRTRDNKCFSSMFYACACVCCSSLKSISRPSLYSRVLSLFFLLFNLMPFSYAHTLENNFDKKKWRRNESEKEKRSHMVPRPNFFFLFNRYEYTSFSWRESVRRRNDDEHNCHYLTICSIYMKDILVVKVWNNIYKKRKKKKREILHRQSSLIHNAMTSTMQVQKTINVLLYIYTYMYMYMWYIECKEETRQEGEGG
jgi:hypothetical protein